MLCFLDINPLLDEEVAMSFSDLATVLGFLCVPKLCNRMKSHFSSIVIISWAAEVCVGWFCVAWPTIRHEECGRRKYSSWLKASEYSVYSCRAPQASEVHTVGQGQVEKILYLLSGRSRETDRREMGEGAFCLMWSIPPDTSHPLKFLELSKLRLWTRNQIFQTWALYIYPNHYQVLIWHPSCIFTSWHDSLMFSSCFKVLCSAKAFGTI